MSVRKDYKCDLCRDAITEESGIGIRFGAPSEIQAIYLHDANTHLCNSCVNGLRMMIAALDRDIRNRSNIEDSSNDK